MKTLAIFAAAAALAVSARGEQITAEPDAFLEYIEATGSQYIDTDVNAETGLKAYVDFAWADFSGNPDWSLLDACINNSDSDKRTRFLMCHMFNGKPFFAYGLQQRRNPANSVPFVGGQRCTIVTDMSSTDSFELIQDGVKTFNDNDREYFATNGNDVNLHLNLFVFATNLSGSANWKGQGKLYEMKIFKKNATTGEFDLLRHYIPCIKDNRAGLYDTVHGTISFSFGSADFIAGSVTNTVIASYVDADGTLHEKVIAIPLDNTMTTLDAGWYVVNSNVTVNSRINLTGNTNLILGDNCTLDVKGIYIPQGKTLTIYAQSDGVTAGKIVSKPTSGAGIGGISGNDNGNIVIYGGIIEATGGKNCAAIGGGDGGDGGTITIYGGNITANGPTDSDTYENGAGIGGGDGGSGGTIIINGGTITTYSRDGAGIGGGDDGSGGTITINGGTITSYHVNQGQGARIGGGCDGAPGTITINGGTITTVGGSGAGIGGGKGNPAGGTVTINGGIINASGSYGIGAGEGGADVAITLGWMKATDQIYASSYNGTVTIADGKTLYNGTEGLSGTINSDDFASKLNGKTLRTYDYRTVSYVKADGTTGSADAIPLTGSTSTVTLGSDGETTWYVVNSDVDYKQIKLVGNVNLILCDGKKMTANGGSASAIIGDYRYSNSLTIYGQSAGTGTLQAMCGEGNGIQSNAITINGGTVNAVGRYFDISAGGNVIINGGNVSATGNSGGIMARGNIILGWTNNTDRITASSFSADGTISIADGQAFINDASTPEVVSGTDIDKALVNGKTLRPCVLLTEGTANDYSDRTSELTTWVGQDMIAAFQRTFNVGKASTICLPFSMTSIEGGKVYQFVGVEYDNTDGWVATMQEADPTAEPPVTGNEATTLAANTPYLFMPAATGPVLFYGTAPASVSAGTTTSGDWTFYGTYSRLTYETTESNSNPFSGKVFGFAAYATEAGANNNASQEEVEAGEFVRATTGAYIPAFRAFLKYAGDDDTFKARGTRSGKTVVPEYITVRLIGKDGGVDAIGEISLNTGEVTFDSNAWYDLSGRKLAEKPTQRGIYINGNKKVVLH